MSDAPIVDGRDGERVLEEARSIVPHYTDDWDPDSGDVGSALLALFSSMAEDVIERLDQVPDKHRVAFFDALGFGRAPPQPARLPVTFQVTDDTDENVAITAGTRVVAPAQGETQEQVFELPGGGGFEGTPANVAAVVSVDPVADDVFGHWDTLKTGTESQLFTGTNLQRHALNVGHTEVLNLKAGSRVWVTIGTNEPDVFGASLKWEFYGEVETDEETAEGWHDLLVDTMTKSPSGNVTVGLRVPEEAPAESGGGAISAETTDREIATIESRWIRCRMPTDEELLVEVSNARTNQPSPGDLFGVEVRSVELSLVDPNPDGNDGTTTDVAIDDVLSGDVPLKVESGGFVTDLYPFGETWPLRNTFYVACEEAFTKPGVTAELDFDRSMKPVGVAGATPSVTLDDRGPIGSTVLVRSTSLPDDGVIVLTDDSGTVRGSVELEAGAFEDVPVTLDSPLTEATTLRAELRAEVTADEVLAETDELEVTPDGGRDPRLSWEYWNGDGWALLDVLLDDTSQLRVPGTVAFEVPDDLEPTTTAGHQGHWIRARVVGGEYVRLAYDVTDTTDGTVSSTVVGVPPHFDSVYLRYRRDVDLPNGVRPSTTSDPDHLVTLNNLDYSVDLAETLESELAPALRPFYGLSDAKGTLYVGFDGELRDGPINLLFSLADEAYPEEFYPRTRWEYRADPEADEWVPIETEDETDGLTRRGVVSLVFTEPTVRSERFGSDLHWIRARIDGQEFDPKAGDGTDEPTTHSVSITDVDTRERRVVLTNTSDQRVELEGYQLEFECANPGDRARTFTAGYTVGPRGTLTVRTGSAADDVPAFPFAFGGSPLADHVRNAVRLLAPDGTVVNRTVEGDPEPCERWLETVPPAGVPDRSPPVVLGIYPNTGWAYNVETVVGERLGASDGTPDQSFTVSSPPVTEETVWVNELSTLSAAERRALRDADPAGVEEVSRGGEEPVAFWVRWRRVDDLLDSEDDRHYLLDPTTGRITFGDGVRGRIPPRDVDSVRLDYRTGGGTAGNVRAGAVTELVSSIPFVDSVTNPEPGDGGADAESVDAVVARAPRELRDRGKAVSGADFERIAMAASRKLARARCIPAMDDAGEYSPGWVTLLIVPNDQRPRPVPSVELKRRVAEAVSEHAPASLVSHGASGAGTEPTPAPELVVRGPSYVEVSVGTTVRAGDVESISALESRISRALDEFLHPLTGSETGDGWGFGELPCLSDLYALLEEIDGVDHVVDLSLTFRGGEETETVTEGEETPNVAADVLSYGGSHTVEVAGTSEVTTTGRSTWD